MVPTVQEGLSIGETAAVLQTSDATVRVPLHRAMAALRNVLRGKWSP